MAAATSSLVKVVSNGTAFDKPVRISNKKGNSSYPQIATSGNNVYVAWTDHSAENDNIFFEEKC